MNTNKNVKKYFDDVSQDYLSFKYLNNKRSFYSVRQNKIFEFIDTLDRNVFKVFLDAGCGPGVVLKTALEKNFIGYGADLSKEMLKLAKKQFNKNSKFLLSNAEIEKLPFKNDSLDVISSAGVIEYLNSDILVLNEFKRILRNDGMLIIPITNKFSYNLLFDDLINLIRSNRVFFALLNYISKNIFKRGNIQPKKFIIRKHSPKEFKATLNKLNFEIIDSSYFYFSPVPYPLNLLLYRFCDFIGRKMDTLGKTKLGCLGEGYIVMCKNKK
jgi:ubiquinone/menaquinone biosynthesis C-methylase UbiE